MKNKLPILKILGLSFQLIAERRTELIRLSLPFILCVNAKVKLIHIPMCQDSCRLY
jgi:hypothetical protein